MNNGILGFPSQQTDFGPLALRAALKLLGTGDTVDRLAGSPGQTAGFSYGQSAIKLAYNIQRVVYNATGDYTVHFITPMPSAHFVVLGCAKQAGGIEQVVNVHQSDTGVTDRVRLTCNTAAGGGAANEEIHVIIFA